MPRILGDLDELLTAVDRRARSDEQGIKKQAEDKAGQLRSQAQGKAKQVREEILRHARAQAEDIRRKQGTETAREHTREYLNERESLLDEVWSQAEERLRDLVKNEEEYAAVLDQLVIQAVQSLGPGKWILASDRTGHELLTKKRLQSWSRKAAEKLGGKIRFERAQDPVKTWGGLTMTDESGKRRVDATFPTCLALAREEIRGDILRKLVSS